MHRASGPYERGVETNFGGQSQAASGRLAALAGRWNRPRSSAGEPRCATSANPAPERCRSQLFGTNPARIRRQFAPISNPITGLMWLARPDPGALPRALFCRELEGVDIEAHGLALKKRRAPSQTKGQSEILDLQTSQPPLLFVQLPHQLTQNRVLLILRRTRSVTDRLVEGKALFLHGRVTPSDRRGICSTAARPAPKSGTRSPRWHPSGPARSNSRPW